MAVGFQLIDLDAVVLPLFNALGMGTVPKDGDGAAGVERQLMMAGHLDKLRRFDRLVVPRRQLQSTQRLLFCGIWLHHQNTLG